MWPPTRGRLAAWIAASAGGMRQAGPRRRHHLRPAGDALQHDRVAGVDGDQRGIGGIEGAPADGGGGGRQAMRGHAGHSVRGTDGMLLHLAGRVKRRRARPVFAPEGRRSAVAVALAPGPVMVPARLVRAGFHRGVVGLRHVLLERLDALGEVAHQAADLAAAEQQKHDQQHHHPMPDAEATHSSSIRGRRRSGRGLPRGTRHGARRGMMQAILGQPIVGQALSSRR